MTNDRAIVEILSETVIAFSNFDFAKLLSLEQRISELVGSDINIDRESANLIAQQKYLLGVILQNFETNLNILKHLHSRNARNQWVR